MPFLRKAKPRGEGASEPVKLLIADHQRVETLFEELKEASSPNRLRSLMAQVDAELTKHTAIEEEVLYPFIRADVPGGDKLIDEAEHEHDEAKQVLGQVSTLDPASPDFPKLVERLEKLVNHHVKEEEGEVFPKLDETASSEALTRLRRDLEQAKVAESPSPSLPDETPVRRPRTTAPRTRTRSASARASGTPSGRRQVWVQPHDKSDGWQVKRDNASRASRVFATQREAESFGRKLARRERTEFILAGADGNIREKNSYGNDPTSTPG